MARYTNREDTMVVLTERRVSRDRFEKLYQSGMTLVEETARYLDSDGREQSRALDKAASTLYAAESMRLTTRLMQVASWLLLQRAANSGEMTLSQMMREKEKLKLNTPMAGSDAALYETLPAMFRALVERSLIIERHIARLDDELYGKTADMIGQSPERNHVNDQIDLLKAAFGGK